MKFLTLLILLSLTPLTVYAGGGCDSLNVLEILSETKDSISIKVEHSGYAGPVAVSERKAVKGKKKYHSIIDIKYRVNPWNVYYIVSNLNKAHHKKKKETFLTSLKTCSKSFKEKIKSKKPQLFCFMGGVFPMGYERVFKVAYLDIAMIERGPDKKLVPACSLTVNPNE